MCIPEHLNSKHLKTVHLISHGISRLQMAAAHAFVTCTVYLCVVVCGFVGYHVCCHVCVW